jgi:hypothetical protein
MDHCEIENQNIAEKYVMGRLSEHECAEFEKHFLACATCVEAVEEISELRGGLVMAGTEAWVCAQRVTPVSQILGRPWMAACAVAFVLLLVAVSALLFRANLRLQREMDEMRVSSSHIGVRVQELEDQAAAASSQVTPPAGNGAARRRSAGSGYGSPRVNVPVFALSATRGSAESNVIAVSPSSEWYVLSIELERSPEYKSYRATIRSEQGQVRWVGVDLRPDRYDSLTMSFPSRFLSSGRYVMALEGMSPPGATLVAEFSFRVIERN